MGATMRAVGYRKNLPVIDPESLIDAELPVPVPGPHDLLVRVEAVSVNPADVKIRAGHDPGGQFKVLGFDAAGTVTATGDLVSRFKPGDQVWYAGSVGRQGTNAEYHLVDEHITGPKPESLTFAEAAALPLTVITAWEALGKFGMTPGRRLEGTLLVLGGAGGVGSAMIQLARALTGLTVIATASRPESVTWVTGLGTDAAVSHQNLAASVQDAAPDGVDFILSPFSAGNIENFAQILRPRGHVVAIDEPPGLDLLPLKSKSISWHWELMFTRPLYSPADPTQHHILQQAAQLADSGQLRTTATTTLGPISAAALREAHASVETSATIGKTVLTGW